MFTLFDHPLELNAVYPVSHYSDEGSPIDDPSDPFSGTDIVVISTESTTSVGSPLRNRREEFSRSYHGLTSHRNIERKPPKQKFYPRIQPEYRFELDFDRNLREFVQPNSFRNGVSHDPSRAKAEASLTAMRNSYFPSIESSQETTTVRSFSDPKSYDPHDSIKYAQNEIEMRTRSKDSVHGDEAEIPVPRTGIDITENPGKLTRLLSFDGTILDFTNDDGQKAQDDYWYMYDPNIISKVDARKLISKNFEIGYRKAQSGAKINDRDGTFTMYDTALLSDRDVDLLLKYGMDDNERLKADEINEYTDDKATSLKHKDPYTLYKQIRPFQIDGLQFDSNDDQIEDLEENTELDAITDIDVMFNTTPENADDEQQVLVGMPSRRGMRSFEVDMDNLDPNTSNYYHLSQDNIDSSSTIQANTKTHSRNWYQPVTGSETNSHLRNWYKPLTGNGINKRDMYRPRGVSSAFWSSSYYMPKRARWIRTRYGYWYAPAFSSDGRGPLDSLASALIG